MSEFYNTNAEKFLQDTQNADMSSLRDRFLAAVPKTYAGIARILDAGTGSGREARALHLAGYQAEAFSASPSMVRAATAFSGVPARQMLFEDFEWEHSFEGIWACASLLHVERGDLPDVLRRLADHLVSAGALYASFKIGDGDRQEAARQFSDMTEESFAALLDECPSLRQVKFWRTEDRRPNRKDDLWLNALMRKA
ncbi:class I SAM-dependent methyltransferase [Alloyangia pacifica]|uniref:class I SAM-dependent methyltransferase n=1 Tax=Alloyangia pacifica TaxID=311180 RepID=UPI000B845AE4|nr:class I SAM-dependent methyltransferase [Alloyangia pacifica]